MKFSTYQELARRTEKPLDFSGALQHGVLGVLTEAGELADPIKKTVIYGAALDATNIAEELGDILWYLALLANNLQLNMDDIAANNIAKLAKRYPEKYSDEAAAVRADKT